MNSAGRYGEYVGVVELGITDTGVKLLNSATLSTADWEIDDTITNILKDNKAKAVEILSRSLYTIDQPLWHDVIEESPITNLIAGGLNDMLDCDFGMINSGIVNAGAFDDLSEKKLIDICPSPLNPTSFEIQGKHIRTALEQSQDAQACLADGRGPGFRGKFVGSLHVSNATIEHDGTSITGIFIGDQPLKDETWYSVASSDYLQRGSGYASLAINKNEKYRAEEIRDVIRMYANQPDFVRRSQIHRWKRSPATHRIPLQKP